MAVDEALLLRAESEDIGSVRFYAWSEPTLSLGYFQSHAERVRHIASANCPLVRRASGGGAILHDQELTYSIALPRSHRLSTSAEKLYFAVHESLVDVLSDLGIGARLCDAVSKGTPAADKPFLCFQRRVHGDVLISGEKIAGSAQRRHGGAVLQHGSILLSRARDAPELPGISELCGRYVAAGDIQRAWRPVLAGCLSVVFEEEKLGEAMASGARRIAKEKYGADSWTIRR